MLVVVGGFACNLESNTLTFLNPSNALQSKTKLSGIKSNCIHSKYRHRKGWAVEQKVQSTGGTENEQDK